MVSAGIDYEYLPGQIPGSLARILLARFKVQRLEASAQSASPSTSSLSPGQQGYTEQYNDQHALGGGTVLIGRNSLKEYLWALKQAWTTPLDLKREHLVAETDIEQVEDEELKEFVRQEGLFDPPSVEAEVQSTSSNSNPILGSAFRDTYAQISKSAQPVFDAPPNDSVPQKEEERPILSPTHIPPQPPLLFVPYSHPLGSMLYWPQKLYSYFFGERANARAGAAAALSLIQAQSRPFEPPRQTSRGLMDDEEYENEWVNETSGKMEADHEDWFPKTVEGDCDFDIHSESYISKVSCPLLFFSYQANVLYSALQEDA